MGEGEKEPSRPRKLPAITIMDLSLDLVKVTTCRYAQAAMGCHHAGELGGCCFESRKINVSDELNPILQHYLYYIRAPCIVVTHR